MLIVETDVGQRVEGKNRAKDFGFDPDPTKYTPDSQLLVKCFSHDSIRLNFSIFHETHSVLTFLHNWDINSSKGMCQKSDIKMM